MKTGRMVRVLVTLGVLTAATGLMFALTLSQDAQFFKNVDEVMVEPDKWYGKRLQLHGFVVPGSILVTRDGLNYAFKVEHGGHVVAATFRGAPPDTFKDESEVVLTGTLTPEGFAVKNGDGIMAKCPSKYDPVTHELSK